MVQGSYNIIGAIIRQTNIHIADYSQRETHNLLFLLIYSFFFFIFTILQLIAIRPKRIQDYEKDPEKVIRPISKNDNLENLDNFDDLANVEDESDNHEDEGKRSTLNFKVQSK